jgi:hypothetical protein
MTSVLSMGRAALGRAAFFLLLLPSQFCRADLLPIGPGPASPVILGFNGSLTYNAATGNFHYQSIPLTYTTAAGDVSSFSLSNPGRLTIDLMVDHAGHFVSNGSGFSLTGSLNLHGTMVTGTLLSGKITAFGAQSAGPPTREFDGLFTIDGGMLTQNLPRSGGGTVFGGFPLGGTGGFDLFAENVTRGILGDFTHNFASSSGKDIDFATPEPPTLVAGLIGAGLLAGFAAFRRRALRPS